jgi:integrase
MPAANRSIRPNPYYAKTGKGAKLIIEGAVDGQRYKITGNTRTELNQLATQREQELLDGIDTKVKLGTFGDALDNYLTACRSDGVHSYGTWYQYASNLRRVPAHLRSMPVAQVMAEDLEKWRGQLVKGQAGKVRKLSARTINQTFSTITAALDHALRTSLATGGRLKVNVAKLIDPLPVLPHQRGAAKAALSFEAIRAARELMPERYQVAVDLMACGLRIGEAIGLHDSDVDYKACVIYVRTQRRERVEPGTSKMIPPKYHAEGRAVPVPKRVVDALRHSRLRHGLSNEGTFLSAQRQGPPISQASLRDAWAKALRLSGGGAQATPHAMRKAYATWLANSGEEDAIAAAWLGHSVIVYRQTYVLPTVDPASKRPAGDPFEGDRARIGHESQAEGAKAQVSALTA